MRNDPRHRHIPIRLRYQAAGTWLVLEALDWNEAGFCFCSESDMGEPLLHLRRGLTHFEGSIVWRVLNTDDAVVQAALVNELLYATARDAATDPGLHQRLIRLMRTPGLVAEKRQALARFGIHMADEEMAERIARRKADAPMYRYGVRVESAAWSGLIREALEVSGAVMSLERLSGALGRA